MPDPTKEVSFAATPLDELYSSFEKERETVEKNDSNCWQRDVSRLIHSASFRRLQGKVQLFPGWDFDFFRNRLTHSIEVSQIAKDIARRINKFPQFEKTGIDLDLIEFAAFAHDLGHPPFAHAGERTLDGLMSEYGGFESNAQTLRILTKLEKSPDSDGSTGLNLTYRSLASIIKHDRLIPKTLTDRPRKLQKGYYIQEDQIVKKIKEKVLGDSALKLKTIECQIVDIADDIANAVYDLEDALKAGFFPILDFFFNDDLANLVKATLKETKPKIDPDEGLKNLRKLFEDLITDGAEATTSGLKVDKTSYLIAKQFEEDSIYRKRLASQFISGFVTSVDIVDEDDKKDSGKGKLKLMSIKPNDVREQQIAILKRYVFQSQTSSSKVKRADFRGKKILTKIFRALEEEPELLAEDYYCVYGKTKEELEQKRVICDYIAGMTDSFANQFYAKLFSETPKTIFKPAD